MNLGREADKSIKQTIKDTAPADAAVNCLVERKGIDGRRLPAKGSGDSRPIADNMTKKGQSRNRRVDFTVAQM